MDTKNRSGYEEIGHTADWSLRVWAPDLEELFTQAASGMQHMMGIQLAGCPRKPRRIECAAGDIESLLVIFLNDILYWIESEKFGCDHFDIKISGDHLRGQVETALVVQETKEIKAVTFHQLSIERKGNTFETTIVFDV